MKTETLLLEAGKQLWAVYDQVAHERDIETVLASRHIIDILLSKMEVLDDLLRGANEY